MLGPLPGDTRLASGDGHDEPEQAPGGDPERSDLAHRHRAERHPGEWTGWSRFDPDYALPGGGESARTFHTRVIGTLRAVAAAHVGRCVAVITHGGVLDMVYRTAHGLSLHGARDCLIPNTGINRVQFEGDAITIVSWADDAHTHGI